MNTHTIHNTSEQDTPFLDVSPALEIGSATPLSTHWIPLHELITHWTEVDPLCIPTPVAPLLTAIGHALFALSRETRARRLSQIARTQQVRLWALIEGVYTEVRSWHAPHHHQQKEVRA